MKKWTMFRVTWTRKESHPAVGDYEGPVFQNYVEGPDARTVAKWFEREDTVFAVKRVQNVDAMQRLKEMNYEKRRA